MGYIDQIRSFLPSIEQDDKASVYVSVQHLREIVDFADNAQSFANDATALLEKAETERKQQDILVAELTQKVIAMETELNDAKNILNTISINAPRRNEQPLNPYEYGFWIAGSMARKFLERTSTPAPEVPSIRELILEDLRKHQGKAFAKGLRLWFKGSEIAESISLLHEPDTAAVSEVLDELTKEGLVIRKKIPGSVGYHYTLPTN